MRKSKSKTRKLKLKGRGIVRHRRFPVRDVGDGGFSTPDPNLAVRDAELVKAARRSGHFPFSDSEKERVERMRNRDDAVRELYEEGRKRLC